MKNINIDKERYNYSFHKMQSHLRRNISEIETIYYWTSNKSTKHYISLSSRTRKLSITLHISNEFSIPDDRILRQGNKWFVTLPKEYDVSTFIYETIFRPDGKRPTTPIRTLIGISPRRERNLRREYRKRVKSLTLSLTREVQNGELAYHAAAIHFSISTGLGEEASLRYFRRSHIST